MHYTLFKELVKAAENNWLIQINRVLAKESIKDNLFNLETILAIASRETNMRHIIGDGGKGFGLMQLDIGSFPDIEEWWDKDLYHYLAVAINHLKSKKMAILKWYGKKLVLRGKSGVNFYVDVLPLSENDLNRCTIASYNCGLWSLYGYFNRNKNPDYVTTGKNYSKDVLTRKEIFKQLINQVALIDWQLVLL